MNEDSLRLAMRQPEAWACLTDHQKTVMASLSETDNVSETARRLGMTRQAVQKAKRLSAQKFLAFAEAAASVSSAKA